MSFSVILKKELHDAFQEKSIWLAIVIFIATSAYYFYVSTGNAQTATEFMEYFALYGLTPVSVALPAVLSQSTFASEKAQGKIEMLLTTPLKPGHYGLAKHLP
jgi:ABC-type Na+ efflux pump permease subunit